MPNIDVIENRVKTLENQRKEDNIRDDKAHQAILDWMNIIAKDVKAMREEMNNKFDKLDRKYVTKAEARIVWSIVTVIVWGIGWIIGKN